MKRRIIPALLLLGAISGCLNIDGGPETGGPRPNFGRSFGPPTVPGVAGPYGTKVPMAAPYNSSPPGNSMAAMQMMGRSVPMNMVQQHPGGMPMTGPPGANMPNIPMPPGMITPPGMPPFPGAPMGGGPNMMQTGMQGPMPGSGVMNANMPPGAMPPRGVMPAQFANSSPVGSMFPAQRTQVFISQPANMKVYWFTQGPDGKPNYSTTPLETPGRYNFAQAAIYRLKLTHIPGRPALELYPTLEVVPTSPKTNEFLAHNSVPLEFTEEDFKQVVDRNYLVKVVYLPDPQFQDGAGAGPDSITSTRLEPGQDPIQEALRRGSILLVVRLGNIDQGLQHSPAMGAPGPGGAPLMMKPPGQGVAPLFQVPFGVPPIAPGGVSAPNVIPGSVGAIAPKVDTAPERKDSEIATPVVPPLPPLPAPPGLRSEDAKSETPAIPSVDIKDAPANLPIPSPTVVPTSISKESVPTPALSGDVKTPAISPITLPPLGPTDIAPASRSDLPMIPMIPAVSGKN